MVEKSQSRNVLVKTPQKTQKSASEETETLKLRAAAERRADECRGVTGGASLLQLSYATGLYVRGREDEGEDDDGFVGTFIVFQPGAGGQSA